MSWLATEIAQLAAAAVVLFLVAALLAPLDSLIWWAGSRRRPDALEVSLRPDATPCRAGGRPAGYVFFLSGAGNMGQDALSRDELHFLERLEHRLPEVDVARDVFPYAASTVGLTQSQPLGGFWRWLRETSRRHGRMILVRLVALRNVLQVAVSADPRYGPVFNFGMARGIVRSLLQRGYVPDRRTPIVLVGLSGGAQIAVGSGSMLHRMLAAPVWVVSIGGVLTSDPGIRDIEHVFHLSGGRDRVQHVGTVLYPGCWPILRGSAWNQALAQGKRTVVPMGPMTHVGDDDYFSRSKTLPDGRCHVEHTVAVVGEAVSQALAAAKAGLPPPTAAAAAPE